MFTSRTSLVYAQSPLERDDGCFEKGLQKHLDQAHGTIPRGIMGSMKLSSRCFSETKKICKHTFVGSSFFVIRHCGFDHETVNDHYEK